MKRIMRWMISIVVVVLLVAGAAVWVVMESARSASSANQLSETGGGDAAPVASVQVAPIGRGVLVEPVIAYGSVIAPPENVHSLSVAFESRVQQVLVSPGQQVSAGMPLLKIEPSATARLQLREAQNAVSAAEQSLKQTTQRYNDKLTTNTELFAAQNALSLAKARLGSLESTGVGKTRQLSASADGIVSKIDARPGQLFAAGVSLMEIAAADKLALELKVEPEDLPDLHVGQAVALKPIDAHSSPPISGKVRMIGRAVDPITRLVDVFVSLPPGSRFLLGQYIQGTFHRTSGVGLNVPRQAVLPSGNGYILFTVNAGRAVQRNVRIVFETDDAAQIDGEHLREGQQAVVVGNYELADGMAVRTTPAKISDSSFTRPISSATADAGPWRRLP